MSPDAQGAANEAPTRVGAARPSHTIGRCRGRASRLRRRPDRSQVLDRADVRLEPGHWPTRDPKRLPSRAPMAETLAAPKPTRWIDAQPGEWAAFGWAFLYFFALLTGYYVLRPVRDAMGAVSRLELLFTRTFVCMLLLSPLYGALVVAVPAPRVPARRVRVLHRLPGAVPHRVRARTRRGRARCSSSGSRCSTCSPCRCSGASWRTCSTTRRRERLYGCDRRGRHGRRASSAR